MTAQVDALLIRSLPELNEAALRMGDLSSEIGQAIDAEIAAWIARNGWSGAASYFSDDTTWLAPEEWMVSADPDERAYLFFQLEETDSDPENEWHLANFTGCGEQRTGFRLYYNTVTRPVFKRLWRELKDTAGLPLLGSDFFLPIVLDRETLAQAVENDLITDALQPLRDALDRLPQLVSQLEPLRRDIVAAAVNKGALSTPS